MILGEVAERCEGSGSFAASGGPSAVGEPWLGTCPVCAQRLELGYAGRIPRHAALAEASRAPTRARPPRTGEQTEGAASRPSRPVPVGTRRSQKSTQRS